MESSSEQERYRSSVAVVTGIGGLYVAQSIIGGITWAGLPAVMRNEGIALDRIGLLSLVALPWAFKFLWAPAVERFRLPLVGRDRSATIVVIGGLLSAIGLFAVGALGPSGTLAVMACLTIVAFAASTVDIACDGYAVQSLAAKHHGWGNAAQVGGAYLGAAIGGGLFLVLVDGWGWRSATWAMAGLVILLGLPFVLGPGRHVETRMRGHTPSLLAALRRRVIRRGMMAAVIYVLAQKAALAMLGPFLIDAGLDLATLGVVNGVGSMIVGALGALLGGMLVRFAGVRAVLVFALLLQAAALAFFWLAAGTVPVAFLAAAAIASSSGIMALGFVALYAQFMRWSDPKQAGVDFTLFQCADALVSMGGGIGAGYVAQYAGYPALFAGAAVIALASVPVMFALCRPDDAGQSSLPSWPARPRRQYDTAR